jgi:inorganic pyrophosphatase
MSNTNPKEDQSVYFAGVNGARRMKGSMMVWVWAAGLMLAASACKKSTAPSAEALQEGDQVMVEVEYPAGDFVADHALLPAPGNWGAITGTETTEGQPVRCLIIGKAVKKGARVEVWPLGAVQWRIGQQLHTSIVAVRTEQGQPPAGMEDFMALRLAHDDVRAMLELWFRHHCMPKDAEWTGWQNEVYAWEEIERARRR